MFSVSLSLSELIYRSSNDSFSRDLSQRKREKRDDKSGTTIKKSDEGMTNRLAQR